MPEERSGWTRTKQPARLPYLEQALYYVVWTILLVCAYYNIHRYSADHRDEFPQNSLEGGWSIFGGKRDAKDFELVFWKRWIQKAWPWLGGHIILGLVCRYLTLRRKQQLMVFFDVVAICWILSLQAVICVALCVVLLAGVAFLTRSLLAVWLLLLICIHCLQWEAKYPGSAMADFVSVDLSSGDRLTLQLFRYSTYFGFLKMASFLHHLIDQLNALPQQSDAKPQHQVGDSKVSGLDQTQETDIPSRVTLLQVLHYWFYLPTYFFGPLFIYHRFNSQVKASVSPWTSDKICALAWDTMRILFWALIIEIGSHLIFYYSIQFNHNIVQELTYWELAGLICTIVPFFYLKYVVIYGASGNVARWDQITPPYTPTCVMNTYKYSEDWRLFDVGLYEFLMRHIYFPLGGSRRGPVRQLVAAAACFSFTCFWHGGVDYLLVWTGFNLFIIGVEGFAGYVVNTEPCKEFERKYLSPAMVRRLSTLFWIPMRLIHTMATLIFIGGGGPAYLFMHRMFVEGFPKATVSVFLAYYVFVQVGMGSHKRRFDKQEKLRKQKTT